MSIRKQPDKLVPWEELDRNRLDVELEEIRIEEPEIDSPFPFLPTKTKISRSKKTYLN